MRSKVDEDLLLFDNSTGEWLSKIININKNSTVLKVKKKTRDLVFEPDIYLIFAPIKDYRLNITIQKATELGVSKFIPCLTDYTNKQNLNYNNLRKNIIEAAEQSERLTIPLLEEALSFDNFVNQHPENRCLIFCDEEQNIKEDIYTKVILNKKRYKSWSLIIGPEGGFSEKERNSIKKMSNAISVSLGKRILRSDTATTAALFCIQSIVDN